MQCVEYVVGLMYPGNNCTVEDQLHTGTRTFVKIMGDYNDEHEPSSPAIYDMCSKKFQRCSFVTLQQKVKVNRIASNLL